MRLTGLPFFGSTDPKEARITEDGEVATTVTERERNVWVHYHEQVAASKWVVLVSLADTVNWPHDATGRLDVTSIHTVIDQSTNTVGYVRYGVITAIDATEAVVQEIHRVPFVNASDERKDVLVNVSPSQWKLGVDEGSLTRGLTNTSETVAALNTGAQADSPLGSESVTPGVGDLVAEVVLTSGGAYEYEALTFYHGEESG